MDTQERETLHKREPTINELSRRERWFLVTLTLLLCVGTGALYWLAWGSYQ